MNEQQSNLVADAKRTAKSLRRTARIVELVALATLVLLVVFLFTDVYGWPAFSGLTLTVIVSVLLAGKMARARSVALEIASAQLELTAAGRRRDDG